MTQQTPISSKFRWQVSHEGILIFDGQDHIFTIPKYSFPVLILNMVKVLKESTNSVD